MQANNPHNQRINRIRQPVALFAYAKNPPEQLTSYAGRYTDQKRENV